MDAERPDACARLDRHLAAAIDALLSLASLAGACGRPELALAASAAMDPLVAFLAAAPVADPPPALDCDTGFHVPGTEPPHARH